MIKLRKNHLPSLISAVLVSMAIQACGNGSPSTSVESEPDTTPDMGAALPDSLTTANSTDSASQIIETTAFAGFQHAAQGPVQPTIPSTDLETVTAPDENSATSGTSEPAVQQPTETETELETGVAVTEEPAAALPASNEPPNTATVGAAEPTVTQALPVDADSGTPGMEVDTAVSNPPQFNSSKPSSIQCMEFPENELGFGSVDNDDWRSWFDPTRHKYSGQNGFLSIDRADNGKQTLRQQLVPNSKGSQTVAAGAYLASADTYRLTQSVYLEPGFDWGGTNEGGKLGFGFGGGSAPSGGLLQTDGFTVRFMWRGNKDGTAHMVIYSYAADRNQSLPYGDDYPLEGFDVPIGEWFDLAMEVTVNSSLDKSDGSLKAWANGQLLLQRDNIQWQSSGDEPAVQGLIYTTFYGGNDSSWSPDQTTYIRFADVCWSPVLEDFDPLQPELGSAVNAEQFAQTKDAEGTIYSDFSEASLPLQDYSEVANTPRAIIIESLSAIELMLPARQELVDWYLYNALARINESLHTENWISNDEITNDSTTITHLFETVRDLQLAAALDNVPDFVHAELNSINIKLAVVAADLANVNIQKAKRPIDTCDTRNDAEKCQRATAHLTQATLELDAAVELSVDNPLASVERSEQARKSAAIGKALAE